MGGAVVSVLTGSHQSPKKVAKVWWESHAVQSREVTFTTD